VYAIIQFAVYFGILLAITKSLGIYMARLFAGERVFLTPVLRPVERGIYRATGVTEQQEMRWTTYAVATLLFNLVDKLHIKLVEESGPGSRSRARIPSSCLPSAVSKTVLNLSRS
jgi:K+-transporting ATPase A subunit